jgi:monoamine oxidase
MEGRRYDAIVIGAGAAGLAAAADLGQAGATTLVLEARDRIGGRILTLHRKGWPLPVELGAEFIHGRPPETFRIVEEAGLLADRLADEHAFLARGRLRKRGNYFDAMSKITGRMRRRGRDRSVAEFLEGQRRTNSGQRADFRSFVEGYHAAPLDRASEHALSTAGDGPPEAGENDQFRVASGYDHVTGWLRKKAAKTVALRLGWIVDTVEWKRGRVSVAARPARGGAAKKFLADHVIVAAPLSALKAPLGSPGAIRFEPEIPEKTRALATLETGDVVKVVFRFRERFWEREGLLAKSAGRFDLSFLLARRATVPTWWTAAPAQAAMLTGWAGGPAARKLLAESDETIADIALRSLARILALNPRRLKSLLEEWHTHNWGTDPFSRGGYSYTAVGGMRSRGILASPVAGTVFFAGEATDPDQNGTVAGALASGRRAAREVLARARSSR